MEKNTMRICADYIGDKVIICGREFPVGSLAIMLLDEGYRDDALLHITVFRTNITEILDDLKADCVESEVLLKMGRDIQIMLGALRTLSPYRWLDIDAEAERIRSLCCEDTARRIEEYLTEKAKIRSQNRAELYIRNKFNLSSSPENMEGCELLDEVRQTAEFYLHLSDDFAAADTAIRHYMREQRYLEKLDESHLLTLALDVFRIPDFDVHTEYVAVEGKNGKMALARRLYFDSYYSLFMTDFFEGLRCGHRPMQTVLHDEKRKAAEILRRLRPTRADGQKENKLPQMGSFKKVGFGKGESGCRSCQSGLYDTVQRYS